MNAVGVLALQGDYAEHLSVLSRLNVSGKEIRTVEDLAGVDALIIPGGESTTIATLLKTTGLDHAIRSSGLPMLATCAGAVVVARDVTGKNPLETLALVDITVDRNAYGSQMESFATEISVQGFSDPCSVAFIRAPIVTRVGSGVEVLATHDGNPVLVRSGSILVATFHTEVTDETQLHELLLSCVSASQ